MCEGGPGRMARDLCCCFRFRCVGGGSEWVGSDVVLWIKKNESMGGRLEARVED